MVQPTAGKLEMTGDHVTNTVAVAGTCAPLWGTFSLSGTLQVVSIIWITLQVLNFFWSKRWGKPQHHHDETYNDDQHS